MRRRWTGFPGTVVILAAAALLAAAPAVGAAQPLTGHFPIEEHIAVLEPESSGRGFPTMVETGLVFQCRLPGTGVVLMDRGRLVWNIDTGNR